MIHIDITHCAVQVVHVQISEAVSPDLLNDRTGFGLENPGVSLPWKITHARRTRVAINQLRGWRLEEVVAVTGRWRPAAASYCILYGVVLWFCGARGRSRASRTGRCNLAAIVIFGTTHHYHHRRRRSRQSCFVRVACTHTRARAHARSFLKLDFQPTAAGNYHRPYRSEASPSLVIRETDISRFRTVARQCRASWHACARARVLVVDQTFIYWLRNAISPLSYFRAIANEDV